MPAHRVIESDEIQPGTAARRSVTGNRLTGTVQYAVFPQKILETGGEARGGNDRVERLRRAVGEDRLRFGEPRERGSNMHYAALDRADEPDVDQRCAPGRERTPSRTQNPVAGEIAQHYTRGEPRKSVSDESRQEAEHNPRPLHRHAE